MLSTITLLASTLLVAPNFTAPPPAATHGLGGIDISIGDKGDDLDLDLDLDACLDLDLDVNLDCEIEVGA
ncbi:MAG TPA: hypothetical protein VGB85_18785, partial [Nannocystis sp.]